MIKDHVIETDNEGQKGTCPILSVHSLWRQACMRLLDIDTDAALPLPSSPAPQGTTSTFPPSSLPSPSTPSSSPTSSSSSSYIFSSSSSSFASSPVTATPSPTPSPTPPSPTPTPSPTPPTPTPPTPTPPSPPSPPSSLPLGGQGGTWDQKYFSQIELTDSGRVAIQDMMLNILRISVRCLLSRDDVEAIEVAVRGERILA